MSNRQLEIVRWISTSVCMVIAVLLLWNPALGKGGIGVLLFFSFALFGLPTVMIWLHLHGQKWSGSRKNSEN